LRIVGLGADGEAGLSRAARLAIEEAELVVGSARQLGLVKSLLRADTLVWPSPLSDGITRVLARRGQSTAVLGSGDPFFFGIGATLAPNLVRGEFICHPAPSSLSLAAARLGWPLQHTEVVSLHGRDLDTLVRYLQPGQRVLALSWDDTTPARVAALLAARGFGPSRLTVLESLGGPGERLRPCRADAFDLEGVAVLNLVGIEVEAEAHALIIPCRASLPDTAFENDGQLTKEDVRAVTLSALRPRPLARLWDVGAGSGSIAIEWLLSHPTCRAIAIEKDPVRCERILRNARALGVPELEVVRGGAPEVLAGLPAPDAVFIGGGASNDSLLEHCYLALARGGRLVVNAVALETEARLLAAYARHGGELRRLSIETAAPLGAMTGWRPAMPVVQWRIQKP